MTRVAFSQRFKEIRKALRLSQAEAGSRIGISREEVSKWENGVHAPPQKRMAEVFDALGVTDQQFWDPLWTPCDPTIPPIEIVHVRPAPYLGTETNEHMRAKRCPRCGYSELTDEDVYCGDCALPICNLCTGPDAHPNRADRRFCGKCQAPTWWSLEEEVVARLLNELVSNIGGNSERE